jgi:hypothetical protein
VTILGFLGEVCVDGRLAAIFFMDGLLRRLLDGRLASFAPLSYIGPSLSFRSAVTICDFGVFGGCWPEKCRTGEPGDDGEIAGPL